MSCAKIFQSYPSQNKKYCSTWCARHSRWKERPKCLQCGHLTKRHRSKFCSIFCRDTYRTIHNLRKGLRKKVKTLPRECWYCGKVYNPIHSKQRYCSRHCGGMTHRESIAAIAKRPRKPITEQTRLKMSIAATKRSASRHYTKGIGGVREDIGHYVRSSWEANFCRYLKFQDINYTYEPDNFYLHLSDKTIIYTPDFKIAEGKYYEVKGWWDERSKLIRELMKNQHPAIEITYIDVGVYREIEKNFKDKIYGWETKQGSRRINAHA